MLKPKKCCVGGLMYCFNIFKKFIADKIFVLLFKMCVFQQMFNVAFNRLERDPTFPKIKETILNQNLNQLKFISTHFQHVPTGHVYVTCSNGLLTFEPEQMLKPFKWALAARFHHQQTYPQSRILSEYKIVFTRISLRT